jgi:hypothetical protein
MLSIAVSTDAIVSADTVPNTPQADPTPYYPNRCRNRHPGWEDPCEFAPQGYAALEYLSATYNVPMENLWIMQEEGPRTYPVTGRSVMHFVIWAEGTELGSLHIFVDVDDNSIVPNQQELENAENAAAAAKYGKFSPMLYDVLERSDDTTLIPVGIWFSGNAGMTELDYQREIATRYPEAQAAMDSGLPPWTVADPQISQAIRQAYLDLIAADIAARGQPLLDALAAMGAVAELPNMLPSVVTNLNKAQLQEIARRGDVLYIDWLGGIGSTSDVTSQPAEPTEHRAFLPLIR